MRANPMNKVPQQITVTAAPMLPNAIVAVLTALTPRSEFH
ncbi:Uncharacterised protein [Nocardia otitidiscaviarum]|uniref:Uncharacterized protein n=1 Tax=Nocardia otitidiscaviarum TaxID=1823 RepID=A0A379JL60_9NOCA|nr:Uncharacterised protein [Nocardia otitidiscaviarum]